MAPTGEAQGPQPTVDASPARRSTLRTLVKGVLPTRVLLWRRARHRLARPRYVDLHVVDHCNLDCRGCAHFSPLATKASIIPVADLEASLRLLRPVYSRFFDSIHLLGGEPLLHPEIARIVRLTRGLFPDTELRVVTNGVLLRSMDDDFWRTCQECDVVFDVSEYPIKLDYKATLKFVEERGVRYESGGRADFFRHVCDPSGSQDARKSYASCLYGGTCIQLRGTRLYPCPRSAYSSYPNEAFGTDFRCEPGDYLDLMRPISDEDFRRFVTQPKPFCRYCDVASETRIPWGRSHKACSEWLGDYWHEAPRDSCGSAPAHESGARGTLERVAPEHRGGSR